MLVASWNVNSVRARLPRVLDYLTRAAPDVVCLQETKVKDELFPHEAFAAHGYDSVFFGQPAYNGVAILARGKLTESRSGFADGQADDPHARLICATYRGVRIASCYVPNGQEMGTEQAAYKTCFYRRLTAKLAAWGHSEAPALIAGDFNVAPRAGDVYDVKRWEKTVLFHPEMRALLAELMQLGLIDVFAEQHPNGGDYSWWDYRHNNYASDRGLRIDLVLANRALARTCKMTRIDREERAGEKPSDHVPVLAEFAVG